MTNTFAKNRDVRLAALAQDLPSERNALLDASAATISAYHDAVLCGEAEQANTCVERLDAIVAKLNGGTIFAICANESAPFYVVQRHNAAKPGQPPMWGQRGEFLIVVDGMRTLVEYQLDSSSQNRMDFHVVDWDAPFISTTGFRSHYLYSELSGYAGRSVLTTAENEFSALIRSEGRKPVEEAFRRRIAKEAPRPWLASMPPMDVGERCFMDTNGQIAMSF